MVLERERVGGGDKIGQMPSDLEERGREEGGRRRGEEGEDAQ